MNALAFDVYKGPPVPKKKKSKSSKKPPVIPELPRGSAFEPHFGATDEKDTIIEATEIPSPILSDEDQSPRQSYETDETRSTRRRLSSKASTANSIPSSLSSVGEVRSQDVESQNWIVQETAEEVVRETDIKKRSMILGRLSNLLQATRRGSKQSTTSNAENDVEKRNIFQPIYEIRTKDHKTWNQQLVQLDTGSNFNLVSKHYVEVILGLKDSIKPVPTGMRETVGPDGRSIKNYRGIVHLTWKNRVSGTSVFLVLDNPPCAILLGSEAIIEYHLLAVPVQTLLYKKQPQEVLNQEKENKRLQAKIKAEKAERQVQEERQRRQEAKEEKERRKKR